MTFRWLLLVVFVALGLSTPATAAWFRAETAHFIVYSDDREAKVRELATELETFDAVLRRFHTAPEQDGAGSNKLTVFVVDNVGAVQRLCGGCPNVYGFYIGRASGSVAFTPRYAEGRTATDINSRHVLFHEYAHHFLFGNYASAYPAWFSEGYAEFTSTFRRDKTGLIVGSAAQHRARSLFSPVQLSAKELFDPPRRRLTPEQRSSVYSRGWLLTHYVMFDPERRAQFERYLKLLNTGTPSLTAATEAFGKLSDLDRALDRYLNSRTLKALTISPAAIPAPRVDMRPLSAGEAAMIDLRLISKRGVNLKSAAPVFAKARPIAARFPDDPVVQGWFAEMAYDALELDAADAATDRALARDPKSAHALLYKGLTGLRRAARDKAPPATWAAARKYLVQANKLDPDNAQPLFSFYRSFADEGRTPTPNAVAGLLRAQELAPQDGRLRFMAASQCIRDGDLARAKQLLKPLAYNPHAAPDNGAARLLAVLETVKDQAAATAALEAAMKEPQDKSDD